MHINCEICEREAARQFQIKATGAVSVFSVFLVGVALATGRVELSLAAMFLSLIALAFNIRRILQENDCG